jgi:hypothetical protein
MSTNTNDTHPCERKQPPPEEPRRRVMELLLNQPSDGDEMERRDLDACEIAEAHGFGPRDDESPAEWADRMRAEAEPPSEEPDEDEDEADVVLAMSDDEIAAEIRARGEDPHEVAERTRAVLHRAVDAFEAGSRAKPLDALTPILLDKTQPPRGWRWFEYADGRVSTTHATRDQGEEGWPLKTAWEMAEFEAGPFVAVASARHEAREVELRNTVERLTDLPARWESRCGQNANASAAVATRRCIDDLRNAISTVITADEGSTCVPSTYTSSKHHAMAMRSDTNDGAEAQPGLSAGWSALGRDEQHDPAAPAPCSGEHDEPHDPAFVCYWHQETAATHETLDEIKVDLEKARETIARMASNFVEGLRERARELATAGADPSPDDFNEDGHSYTFAARLFREYADALVLAVPTAVPEAEPDEEDAPIERVPYSAEDLRSFAEADGNGGAFDDALAEELPIGADPTSQVGIGDDQDADPTMERALDAVGSMLYTGKTPAAWPEYGFRARNQDDVRAHELRCWAPYFDEIKAGRKTFELRRDDRGYQKGDELVLVRADPEHPHGFWTESGAPALRNEAATLRMRVTYITHGGRFGLQDGWVCMGISEISEPAYSSSPRAVLDDDGGNWAIFRAHHTVAEIMAVAPKDHFVAYMTAEPIDDRWFRARILPNRLITPPELWQSTKKS